MKSESRDAEDHTDVMYIKKGLLYKRRNGFGRMMPNAWNYRFFTLTSDGILDYYDMGSNPVGASNEDNKPRGQLALGYMQYKLVREPSIDGAPTPYAIEICPEGSGEKWSLCADAEADHHQWCLELEQFLHVNHSIPKNKPISYDNDGEDANSKNKEKNQAQNVSSSPSRIPKSTKVGSGKSGKSGKASGFKMQKVESQPLFSAENLEGVLTVTIANYCFALVYSYTVSKSSFDQIASCPSKNILAIAKCLMSLRGDKMLILSALYFFLANFFVIKTLCLRAGRIEKLEKDKRQLANELAAALSRISSESASFDSSLISSATKESDIQVTLDENQDTNKPIMRDGKPIPGCTVEEVNTPQRLSPMHTWSRIDSSDFNVRIGPNYSWNKKKAPSPPALYEPFACDIFCSNSRIDHAAQKFALPEEFTSIHTGHPDVPPIFVVQIQIPLDEPSFLKSVSDGPGWSIMIYLRITEDTLKQLKDFSSASPAVKLWAKWCGNAMKNDDLRKRFKFISSCSNLIELGIPQSIVDYNAKPILIRRTGSLYRGINNTYMEFDMHIHKFDTAAKKAIHFMTSKAGEMFMQIAFVIEGRDDEELPEVIFGAIACNKPQEEMAGFIFD